MFVRNFSHDNVFFDHFRLEKGADRHGECHFSIKAADKTARSLMGQAGQPLQVSMGRDDSAPVFNGTITKISCKKGFAGTNVEVWAISDSAKIDAKGKWHIFQNPEKTFGQIIEKLKTGPCKISMQDEFKNKACKPVILQAEESDFAFLLRLAHLGGSQLWINDGNQGQPSIHIGPLFSDNVIKLQGDKIIDACIRRDAEGLGDFTIKSQEFINPGFLVSLPREFEDSSQYLIHSLVLEQEHGRDIFTYEAKEYRKGKGEEEIFARAAALKLLAKVLDNKDQENLGRIKVAFNDAGNQMEIEDSTEEKDKLWLTFSPPWGGKEGGIVFVPDKDEIVETLFVDGQLFANATRRVNALNEELQNVTDKAIANNSRQRIFWKEKSLELYSSETFIKMDEKQIEMKAGENIIRMNEDGILLQTPKNSIRLTDKGMSVNVDGESQHSATGALKLQSESAASIKAQDDLSLSSSNAKANLTGNEVNIIANRGDAAISGSKVKLG